MDRNNSKTEVINFRCTPTEKAAALEYAKAKDIKQLSEAYREIFSIGILYYYTNDDTPCEI